PSPPRRSSDLELMLPFDVAPRLGRQQILRVLDVADTARVNLIPTEALVGASNVRLELAARHRRTIVRTRKARTQDERCGTEPLSKGACRKDCHGRAPADSWHDPSEARVIAKSAECAATCCSRLKCIVAPSRPTTVRGRITDATIDAKTREETGRFECGETSVRCRPGVGRDPGKKRGAMRAEAYRGRGAVSLLPALRTVRAVLPHTALRSVVIYIEIGAQERELAIG